MSATRTITLTLPVALLAVALAGCTSSQAPSPDSQPASPSVGSTASSPGASAQAAGCFVQLFDSDDLDENDDNVTVTEAGRYTDLRSLPGAGTDWTDEADSIRVGPDATVTVWPQTGFAGQSSTLKPGDHAHLDPEPSSLVLDCTA